MDCIKYNDFKNICRICLLSCDDKCILDHIITDIYYKLTEIYFVTNDELPQQICIKCFENINEIDAFALKCKQGHSTLTKCLNEYKNIRINEEKDDDFNENIVTEETSDENTNQNDLNVDTATNEFEGLDEFEEHKVEFIKVENVNDELQIKQEIIEETIDELKIVPESEPSYKCDLCPETFKLKKILNVHKRKHGVKLSFLCEACNKSFNRSNDLKVHKRVHSGVRPFACEICNKTFIHSSHLNVHKRIHSDERPYACEICSKSFNSSCHLNAHKRIHSGERPYKCEICNKTFIQSSDLNKHKRIHSGERPYECDICNKTFNQSSTLTLHKRVHSGERSYGCEICNKSFNHSSSFARHELTHSNGRNICRKSLETSSGSKSHTILPSDELPYKCDICPKSYKRLSLLDGHKKTHKQNVNDSDDTSN